MIPDDEISYLTADINSSTVRKRKDAAARPGKSGEPCAIGPLSRAIANPHPGVRRMVVQALGKLGYSPALP